jgi:hypothetical protein
MTLSVAEPSAPSVASLEVEKERRRAASRQHASNRVRSTGTAVSHQSGKVDAYREEAKIMRIYIAPWQDNHGDLHLGGYIYSDITPKMWAVVQHGETGSDHLLRLLMPRGSKGTEHPVPAQGSRQSARPASSASSADSAWQAGSHIPSGEPGGKQ